MVLSGNNTYSGSTTISGGTLQIGGAGCLGGGNYAAAIANSGALVVNTSSNQTFGGAITGSGSLTQSGPGMLTLSNAGNTYSGATNVLGGTLFVSGAVAAQQRHPERRRRRTFSTADGTARTTTVGGLNLGSGANLAMDWGDQLATAATATASGNITLIPSGSFTSGTPYTLVKAAGGLGGANYLLAQQHQLHGGAQRLLDQRDASRPPRPRPWARPTGTAGR